MGTTLWRPDPDPSVSGGRSETREKGPKNVRVISCMRVRGHLNLRYQVHSKIMAGMNPYMGFMYALFLVSPILGQ